MIGYATLIEKSINLISPSQGKYRHFSYICRKNEILSYGLNDPKKSHTLAAKHNYYFPFKHSELSSLVRFPETHEFLKKCYIVNIRLGRDNQVLLSRPCQNCQKLLLAFELKDIYYSNEYGKFERLLI